MQSWMGWTSASAGKMALTWDEWCAYQRRILSSEKRQQACQQESVPFSDRELARLSFVRWLYQTGRLDPAQHDNV